MSFDQDPHESVTISGSDFAEMCDEIKRLTAQKDDLLAVLEEMVLSFADIAGDHCDDCEKLIETAEQAIAKAKGEG